jgi:CheY-like chemotaxis protein
MPSRILIVEDELIIAADLRNKLQRLGHDVIGMAMAGEEAILMADKLRPDLVLMDVQLEGQMSGIDAARTIQQRTGVPIIFITAFPGVFVRAPGDMQPPGVCLGKPFSGIQLQAALDVALAKPSQTGGA